MWIFQCRCLSTRLFTIWCDWWLIQYEPLVICCLSVVGWLEDSTYDATVPLLSQMENPAYDSTSKSTLPPPVLPKPQPIKVKPPKVSQVGETIFHLVHVVLCLLLRAVCPLHGKIRKTEFCGKEFPAGKNLGILNKWVKSVNFQPVSWYKS